MKVYRYEKEHNVFIQPGKKFPANTEWKDAEKNPIMFTITFKDHAADVSPSIGRYMIDEGLAFKTLQAAQGSGIILPMGVVHA